MAANAVYVVVFGLLAVGILSDCDFDSAADYIMFILSLVLCQINLVSILML